MSAVPRGHDRDRQHRRSLSPGKHRHHDKRERSRSPARPSRRLPSGAHQLSKHDLRDYRAVFAVYLDVQKGMDIDEISSDEVKGRWKSFLGKWNHGDLAEGWYDPETKTKADSSAPDSRPPLPPVLAEVNIERTAKGAQGSEDEEDDDYGPALPGAQTSSARVGPAVPKLQDLQQRNEQTREDREEGIDDLRYMRKLDRKRQKERLEELAPRAEPGSRERQLEKKRETAVANRSFREAKSPGAEEVPEAGLMGDDGVETYKAQIKATEKKKNERELRKEDILRAREAEREERLAVHRAKEEKTMDMLKAIARQRFG